MAECVNTIEMHDKVNPILAFSLSNNRNLVIRIKKGTAG